MCDCSLGKRCKKIAKEIRGGEKESLQAESHMVERLAKKHSDDAESVVPL
jgi:hypothetical protein